MFKKLIITAIIILTYYVNVNSQCNQEWVQRYNGPANTGDGAESIAMDALGNVYVTGYSYGSGTSSDYATIKYNSSGVQQWIQRYNGPANGSDRANSLAIDVAGNVYVTGESESGTTYETKDYATIKYNPAGIQQWVTRYNGPGNSIDYAYSIAIDGAGNVYVTGGSRSGTTSETEDYATIKYNSAGVQQWIQRYNGPGNGIDYAYSIAIDGAGNVYVTGRSTVSGINYDYATIKYDSSGVQQWIQRYNGPGNGSDYAYSIAIDGAGNVYITGSSYASGTSYDYATIKYNSSGVQQWVQRYNGPGNSTDQAESIAIDAAGNVYVTGYSIGSGTNSDFATIKYNSSGVQQWVQRYNGPLNNSIDHAKSIAIDATGNVYVTGDSKGSGTSDDYATIKYDSAGVQQWVQRYNGPGNDVDDAYSLSVDGAGNVYVTGRSAGSGTSSDYATIKYSQSVTSVKEENEIPGTFKLYQNYPNPFNPSTIIKYDISKAQNVKLSIYDLLGREVSILVNEFKQAGKYEINFDASGLSSGTYFYKLVKDSYGGTNEFIEIKKFILIK